MYRLFLNENVIVNSLDSVSCSAQLQSTVTTYTVSNVGVTLVDVCLLEQTCRMHTILYFVQNNFLSLTIAVDSKVYSSVNDFATLLQ
jgi:hypothetical protein